MPWPDIILKNFWWKVVSLLLACVVWFTFHTGDKIQFQPRTDFNIATSKSDFIGHPITVMTSAGDARNFKLNPQTVDITVSGDASVLRKLTRREIQAFVDLTDGKQRLTNVNIQVFVPRGVRVERVDPPEAQMQHLD